MSIQMMREALLKQYPGEKWKWRVDNMSDNQVIETYNSMLSRGILKK